MHVDVVRDALHQQPFRPFTLRLADGRSLHVSHPDFVAISPRRVYVVNPVDESSTWLEPLLILSIDYAGPSPSAAPADDGAGAS